MNYSFIAILVIPTIIIEYLICKFTHYRFLRYILPLLSFIIGVVLILYPRFVPMEGMKDLANIVMGIMCFIIAICSFLTAIVFEHAKRKRI